MILPKIFRIPLLAFTLTFVACGGGGGGGIASVGGGGIGGTGFSSSGTIDGFGSIFVNGVEYETDDAEIEIDGEGAPEGELGLGMVVMVFGSVNPDGVTGTATKVVFDEDVEGPVQTLEADADGDSMLITVVGVEVIVERTSTVFEGVAFDTLALDDVVEVSGFPNGLGQLRATRVEKSGDFVAGVTEVEVEGQVESLAGNSFSLGGVIVDFSSADLSEVPGGVLSEGMFVEVEGTLDADVIQASSIEAEDEVEDAFDDDEELRIQGTISDFVSVGNFMVNGVQVDASSAVVSPAGLQLSNGEIIEVEGIWDGAVLRAEEVEARRGRIEIEASVAAVDAGAGTITLQLFGGTVVVEVDERTLLEDDTGAANTMSIGDIRTGDFLEVEAIMVGDALMATLVDRDETDDDVVQAPVESFVAGGSITVLGISYSTVATQFEDGDDSPVSSEQFFANLQVGMLVKITDESLSDGVADEVEFESEQDLDGEIEFEDDESEDDEDCEDDGCDDDDESDDEECEDDEEAGCDDDDESDDEECEDDEEAGCDDDDESDDEECEDGEESDCDEDEPEGEEEQEDEDEPEDDEDEEEEEPEDEDET